MQIYDAPNPSHPAFLEAILCSNIAMILKKQPARLTRFDTIDLTRGIDYLDSTRRGYQRGLKDPIDSQTALNTTRAGDFIQALFVRELHKDIEVLSPYIDTSDHEFVNQKITKYLGSLDRLRRGDPPTEDHERLLPEQVKVWLTLEEINQRKASRETFLW